VVADRVGDAHDDDGLGLEVGIDAVFYDGAGTGEKVEADELGVAEQLVRGVMPWATISPKPMSLPPTEMTRTSGSWPLSRGQTRKTREGIGGPMTPGRRGERRGSAVVFAEDRADDGGSGAG